MLIYTAIQFLLKDYIFNKAASDGEKASNNSAAINPTGNRRNTNGGGGNGGNISGRTTIDAASATRIRMDPALKNSTMPLPVVIFCIRFPATGRRVKLEIVNNRM